MEKGISAADGVFSGAIKRKLLPDDEFFDAGNIQRAVLSKMSVFSLESGCNDGAMTDGEEDSYLNTVYYQCRFNGCKSTFSSLVKYEAHYNTSHRNRCKECGRSFPTNRLLDLHLSEEHDSFFKAVAERRPMYRCLVEGCTEVCMDSKMRRTHLVDVHRYPRSFDFSRPSCMRGSNYPTKKGNSAKGGTRRTKAAGARNNSGGMVEVQAIHDDEACGDMGASAEAVIAMDTSGDMVVDEIVEGMDNLNAKLSVPSTLSFGRSARRRKQRANNNHWR